MVASDINYVIDRALTVLESDFLGIEKSEFWRDVKCRHWEDMLFEGFWGGAVWITWNEKFGRCSSNGEKMCRTRRTSHEAMRDGRIEIGATIGATCIELYMGV